MKRAGLDFFSIVLVRNDVYQLLMDETADFGKESCANLDWSDPDMLRKLVHMRLLRNNFPPETDFETAWNSICVSHIDGEESSQYVIDRCLMRPRNLIKLINACRGFAINLQQEKIEATDIKKGLASYSNDLLVDADQELTDIAPNSKRLIYQFLGEDKEFDLDELKIVLEREDLDDRAVTEIIEFLLYYGFLGIKYADQDAEYIYHVSYNMEILKTRIQKNEKAIKFVFNPAFWPALNIS